MTKLKPVTAAAMAGLSMLPDDTPPVAIKSGIMIGSSISMEEVIVSIVS